MGESGGGAEKRRFKRIDKKFTVEVRVYPNQKIVTSAKYDEVSLKNISAGGALFVYTKELKPGALIDLNIKSSMLTEPIKCLGKIIRVDQVAQSKAAEQPPQYCIAVRFIETMDRKEQDTINNVVEEYLSREKDAKG